MQRIFFILKTLLLFLIMPHFVSNAQNGASSVLAQKTINDGYAQFLKNDFNGAISLFEKASSQALKAKDTTEFFHAYKMIFGVWEAQAKQGEFLKYEKELKRFERSKNIGLISIFNCLGAAHQKTGNFELATKYFNNALNFISQKRAFSDELLYHQANTYNFLSSLQSTLGDYTGAIQYVNLSLNSYLKIKEKLSSDSTEIGNQYNELCKIYSGIKDYDKAYFNLKNAKKYFSKNDFYSNLSFYQNLAILYKPTILNKPDSSRKFISEAFSIQIKNKLDLSMGKTYEIKGELEYDLKDFEKAERSFQNSLSIRIKQKAKRQIAITYKNIARCQIAQNNVQEALENLQKSLLTNSSNGVGKTFSVQTFIYKNDAIETYKETLIALSKIYKKEGKEMFLNMELDATLKANQLIDYQRNSFELEASKLELGKIAKEIYGLGIMAAYEKYQLTKDKKYVDLAFEYAEKSKNIVLFEAVKTSQTTSFGNVPKGLIERERKLNQYLSVYENQMLKDKNHEDVWRKKLLESTKELEELKEKIQSQYPNYFQYKYENKPISATEVQGKLKDNQALISYVLQENSLYILAISPKGQLFVKQNLSSDFQVKFSQFRNLLITKASDQSYIASSNNIYENLFPKTIQDFLTKNNTQKLKIIADGYIHYLPFEMLIINKLAKLKSKNIYLLEKFTINYLPSATFQWKLANSSSNHFFSKSYTAFSPQFEKPNDLPFNRQNVEYLASNLSSKTFLNAEANLASYLKNSPQASGIMHMSMHGAASASDPMNSYLALGKDTLFAHDVYAQNIAAKLTVLDACETGLGNLNEGEGVMSLARAYLHAGSQAVAMSLWKLPSNGATGQIIRDFIELSNEGIEKDEALRIAKLNYLNAHRKDLLAGHPYFWAPMVVVGNAEPISSGYFKWIILGILAVGLGFVWRMRK